MPARSLFPGSARPLVGPEYRLTACWTRVSVLGSAEDRGLILECWLPVRGSQAGGLVPSASTCCVCMAVGARPL